MNPKKIQSVSLIDLAKEPILQSYSLMFFTNPKLSIMGLPYAYNFQVFDKYLNKMVMQIFRHFVYQLLSYMDSLLRDCFVCNPHLSIRKIFI